jgi:hypothetical protein
MFNQTWSQKISTIFIYLLVIGFVGLTLSIFSDSYPSTRSVVTIPTGTLPSTTPEVLIIDGLTNDENSEYGPWPISSSLARFQISSPLMRSFDVEFDLTIDIGMCITDRTILLTFNNQTERFVLRPTSPTSRSQIKLKTQDGFFQTLVVQVEGPVCQVSTDPRLFWGILAISNFSYSYPNEFDFK